MYPTLTSKDTVIAAVPSFISVTFSTLCERPIECTRWAVDYEGQPSKDGVYAILHNAPPPTQTTFFTS